MCPTVNSADSVMLTSEVTVVLEFVGASKRFGPLDALDDCSFTARPGQLTGSLGPNGARKTTAMRAATGVLALTAAAKANQTPARRQPRPRAAPALVGSGVRSHVGTQHSEAGTAPG